MSVLKKGRRKIVCNDLAYIWFVELDHDSPYYILHIVSENKALILACPLEMETAYIISKGNVFQNKKTNGKWNRYLLPFEVPKAITPKFVSEVIVWATQGEHAVEVEWDCKDIII